jgi:hypothetical protein
MKNPILQFVFGMLLSAILLSSCDSPSQNVEDAQAEVDKANAKLDLANEAYRLEMAEFRAKNAEKIAANEKSMADFQARIAAEKVEAKEEYLAKIDALNHKNSDLKKKMDDFQAGNRSSWGDFRREFDHDMDVLRDSLEHLVHQHAK